MNILAIEANASGAAVALLRAEGEAAAMPRAVQALAEPRALAANLIPTIEATLRGAGCGLDDVDAIGVGTGPGSWTSLRIALSTAKTLAQVRCWPLVGVPSYDAVAAAIWRAAQDENELPPEFLLLVAGRCRPGEVYAKIFAATGEYLALVQPEWLGSPQMMADTLGVEAMARQMDNPMVLAGDGAAAVAEVLATQNEPFLQVELPAESLAIEIGRATQMALARGEASNPLLLQPLYLAPSAAERNFAPNVRV